MCGSLPCSKSLQRQPKVRPLTSGRSSVNVRRDRTARHTPARAGSSWRIDVSHNPRFTLSEIGLDKFMRISVAAETEPAERRLHHRILARLRFSITSDSARQVRYQAGHEIERLSRLRHPREGARRILIGAFAVLIALAPIARAGPRPSLDDRARHIAIPAGAATFAIHC